MIPNNPSLTMLAWLTVADVVLCLVLMYVFFSGAGGNDAAAGGDILVLYGPIFLAPIASILSFSKVPTSLKVKKITRAAVLIVLGLANIACLTTAIFMWRVISAAG